MAKYVLWAPRLLMLIIIAFIVLMAFDNYSIEVSSGKKMESFFTGIAPALALLAGMIIGWKHKMAGGIIIIVIGLIMTLMMQEYRQKLSFLLLSTPVLVTGILYILNWFYDKPSRQK